jgi:hypothetical protein
MKTLTLMILSLISSIAFSQVEDNEFIQSTQSISLDATNSGIVFNLIGSTQAKNGDVDFFIQELSRVTSIDALLTSYRTNIDDGNDAYAVIIIYRQMDATKLTDPRSVKTIIYHRARAFQGGDYSNYLLETKHVALLFLDLEESAYRDGVVDPLSNSKVTITYNTSYFRQSMKDLAAYFNFMSPANFTVKATWVELEPKRIKAPCVIVAGNTSFTSDLKFEIHERNVASFQIGVANNKFNIQDFQIKNGNLIVSPDTAKQTNWKSNMFMGLELHLPRDVDNFRPIWKDLFQSRDIDWVDDNTKNKYKVWNYLYRNTLSRIGVYGGLKASKDPLSNLYAGFNYAITKELALNLGWVWNNEIVPQVTAIGNITSLSDAKEFAKREYSKPTFSIGLTFSPSSAIEILGLRDEKKKEK